MTKWALFMLSTWMDSVPSVPLGSHLTSSLPPSFPCLRQKVHGLRFTSLQPLCLSGWFTLHWPGLGLPGPHYQLLATGTYCSWQTQGKGIPYRNSSSEKGVEEVQHFHSPIPDSWSWLNSSIWTQKQKKTHLFLAWFFCMFWSAPGFVLIDGYSSSKYLIKKLYI